MKEGVVGRSKLILKNFWSERLANGTSLGGKPIEGLLHHHYLPTLRTLDQEHFPSESNSISYVCC